MPKFLFFDIDGTLVSPTTRKIPKRTKQAIQKAMDLGHYCFFCTGRNISLAKDVIDELDMSGIVFNNGAGVYYQGKYLYLANIEESLVEQVVFLSSSLGGGCSILSQDIVFQNEYRLKMTMRHHSFIRQFAYALRHQKMKEFRISKNIHAMEEYQHEPIQKIDIMFDSELSADIFFSRLPSGLEVVFAGGYHVGYGHQAAEITAKGIHKGIGILKTIEALGGHPQDVYVFGDSTNDIGMLEMFPHSIAMGNGSPQVKQIASFVTKHVDDDGIVYAMEHFKII